MPRQSPILTTALDSQCAIARCLGVLSDSWSFLLLREAFLGKRTFAQFRDSLGIATDVLSTRLNKLVEHGVLVKTPYREPGHRTRDAYELTAAGHELKVVLVAMQQWGEAHVPRDQAPTILPLAGGDQGRVRAVLMNAEGISVGHQELEFVRVADQAEAGVESLDSADVDRLGE